MRADLAEGLQSIISVRRYHFLCLLGGCQKSDSASRRDVERLRQIDERTDTPDMSIELRMSDRNWKLIVVKAC